MYIVFILALIVGIVLIFWQGSLLFATLSGAPSVFAKQDAVGDCLKLAKLKKGELLIDLGCGDARALIMGAQKFGARGIGVEKSPYCFLLSKFNVWRAGQSANIKVIFGDFKALESYLSKADVVYLYLLPQTLARLETWLFKNIGNQTRIISLAFSFKKHQPQAQSPTVNFGKNSSIHLYRK